MNNLCHEHLMYCKEG